jgi:hypothetical protein
MSDHGAGCPVCSHGRPGSLPFAAAVAVLEILAPPLHVEEVNRLIAPVEMEADE